MQIVLWRYCWVYPTPKLVLQITQIITSSGHRRSRIYHFTKPISARIIPSILVEGRHGEHVINTRTLKLFILLPSLSHWTFFQLHVRVFDACSWSMVLCHLKRTRGLEKVTWRDRTTSMRYCFTNQTITILIQHWSHCVNQNWWFRKSMTYSNS
jgi:hypothetical protein